MKLNYYEFEKSQLDINIDFFGREACLPDYSFGPSVRENYVLHYILKGQGKLSIDNFTYSLQEGDCFILPKGQVTYYQAGHQEPWEYVWVGLSGTKIEEFLKRSLLFEEYVLQGVGQSHAIESFLKLVDLSSNISNINQDILMASTVYHFLYTLAQEFPSSQVSEKTPKDLYFQEAINFIGSYFNRDVKVTDICRHLNISRGYLHSIFKEKIELSPKQYLLKVRMDLAAEFLLSTANPISIIATSIGYKDPLNFSKAFTSYFGVSATKYREEKETILGNKVVFTAQN